MGWECGGDGGVRVLPLLSGFSCKVYTSPSISPRFYFKKHTFCFLPLVPILESPLIFNHFTSNLLLSFYLKWVWKKENGRGGGFIYDIFDTL
jgi:hypothetical protein